MTDLEQEKPVTRAFVSYSRLDKPRVLELVSLLEQRGINTWVDWEQIPMTADWWREIEEGIESADAFAFIISTNSLTSKVCGEELQYALEHNKRLIPILIADPEKDTPFHEAISAHNWVFMRDGEEMNKNVDGMVAIINTDLAWVQAHTRLLEKAVEWNRDAKNPSLLLRGDTLLRMETECAEVPAHMEPQPTALQMDYLSASRVAETRRKRFTTTGGIILGLLAVVVAYFVFVVFRNPTEMTAEFNVAFADILVEDASGALVASEDGTRLAEYMSEQVTVDFDNTGLADAVGGYEIWPPKYTGTVEGASVEERELAAQALAEEIHAHIIVYGVLKEAGDKSSLSLEFYINPEAFEEADEIVGQYQLGDAIRISLPLSEEQQLAITYPALAGRVTALSNIALGLGYYSNDAYKNALPYFDTAFNEERWIGSAGKEVVQLFIGNSYLSLTAIEKDPEVYLQQSEASFLQALEINPDYGRAGMGLASAMFLDALGDPGNTDDDDLPGIVAAQEQAAAAAAMPDQPVTANLAVKARFLDGQIALVYQLHGYEGKDWTREARAAFEDVVAAYNAGNTRVKNLASQAYARLGVLDFIQDNGQSAVDNIQLAISIASPVYEGEFNALLGDVYCAYGEAQAANDAYEEAYQVAVSNADTIRATQYQAKSCP